MQIIANSADLNCETFCFKEIFMDYKQIGSSDLQISRIGFGCMSLQPAQRNLQQLFDAAIASGINYFDTADLYDKGLNESLLGNAIKTYRNKIIIASKGGNEWKSDGSGWSWNPRKAYLLKAVEGSLKRLQTDRIDLYQLHGGTIEDPIDEILEAFELMIQQGKIRYYGISSIRPNVIREFVKRSAIISVMVQYSLLDRRPEETILPLLEEHKIGVLARGAVAGGLLIDKPPKPYLSYSEKEVSLMAMEIKKQDFPQPSTAVGYVLQNPAVTAAIVGIRTAKHLESAVSAVQFPLPPGVKKVLQDTLSPNRYSDHR